MTIENVNIGICHHRVQTQRPPYFVNYTENGVNKYIFFAIRSSCESVKDILLKQSKKP